MINHRCRHYRASRPCVFNKADGSECPACRHVSEYKERILFIKLDAIGDVLRSASLLPAIKTRHRDPFIAWLTRSESAELVGMMDDVDEVIELSEPPRWCRRRCTTRASPRRSGSPQWPPGKPRRSGSSWPTA